MQHLFIRHLLKESRWDQSLHLLMEDYRLEKIEQMVNKRLPENERLNVEQLEKMILADPTSRDGAGKYSEWIVKQYIQADKGYKKRFFDDLYKYTNALKRYHELKTRNKVAEKDINKIKDLFQLQELIHDDTQESVLSGFPDTSKLESSGDVEVILRNPNIHIYWTKTHRANTILGSNTEWCTVPKDSDAFDEYNKDGPIFILYQKTPDGIRRFQYHFDSEQFMNEKDIEDNSLLKFGFVKKAFLEFAKKYHCIDIAIFYKDRDLFRDPKIQFAMVSKRGINISYLYNPSEKIQLVAVKQDGKAIVNISNPSERVQLAAVTQNGYAIEYIKNPSEKVKLEAVKRTGGAIEHIKNPTEQMQLIAVEKWPATLYYLKNPSEAVQLTAVKNDGCAIQHIKNPSEAVQLAAVTAKNQTGGYAIQYIDNPSKAVQLVAVTTKGFSIKYIKNPTEQMQLIAVENYPYALQYIRNPSEAVQLATVTKDGVMIKLIKNPSEAVQLAAVTQNGYALVEIIDVHKIIPSDAVKLAAVKNDGQMIKYIENPTEQMQLTAIKSNPLSIMSIKNPTEKVQMYILKHKPARFHYVQNKTKKVIQLAREAGLEF